MQYSIEFLYKLRESPLVQKPPVELPVIERPKQRRKKPEQEGVETPDKQNKQERFLQTKQERLLQTKQTKNTQNSQTALNPQKNARGRKEPEWMSFAGTDAPKSQLDPVQQFRLEMKAKEMREGKRPNSGVKHPVQPGLGLDPTSFDQLITSTEISVFFENQTQRDAGKSRFERIFSDRTEEDAGKHGGLFDLFNGNPRMMPSDSLGLNSSLNGDGSPASVHALPNGALHSNGPQANRPAAQPRQADSRIENKNQTPGPSEADRQGMDRIMQALSRATIHQAQPPPGQISLHKNQISSQQMHVQHIPPQIPHQFQRPPPGMFPYPPHGPMAGMAGMPPMTPLPPGLMHPDMRPPFAGMPPPNMQPQGAFPHQPGMYDSPQ